MLLSALVVVVALVVPPVPPMAPAVVHQVLVPVAVGHRHRPSSSVFPTTALLARPLDLFGGSLLAGPLDLFGGSKTQVFKVAAHPLLGYSALPADGRACRSQGSAADLDLSSLLDDVPLDMKGKKGIAEDQAGVARLKERQARVEALAEEKARLLVQDDGRDADERPVVETLQGMLKEGF